MWVGVSIALAVLFIYGTAEPASAAGTWMFAGGRSQAGGSATVGHGVYGQVYTYTASGADYDERVNAIYASTLAGSFVEAGWIRRPGIVGPFLFTRQRNVQTGSDIEDNFPWSATDNTWHALRLSQRTPLSTTDYTYEFYVDARYHSVLYNTGVTSCYADIGAERYDTRDINKMSMIQAQYLKKTSATTAAWTFWPGVGRTSPVTIPPFLDNVYSVYGNKLSAANHQVYIDDHQN